MTTTINRTILDNEDAIASFYQGIEESTGKTIKKIIQKGLTVVIEFEKSNLRKVTTKEIKEKGGKDSIPIYMYSESMKFILTFLNQTECQKYYGLTAGNLFYNDNTPFRKMLDGSFICKSRLGREGLRKALFIYNSRFCKVLPEDKAIDIFNVLGEKIGSFRSIRELKEICSISPQTIHQSFTTDTKSTNKREKLKELYFKLKS